MRVRAAHLLTCLAAGSLVLGAAACGGSPARDADDGKVTITVAGAPPRTQPDVRKDFLAQVAAFEAANPDVRVKPSEAKWDAKTFAARLAGGQLETVFQVPLTEPPGMIKRRQVADITEEAKLLPHFARFDPRALAPAKGLDGKVYGLPTSEYALGLVYNRELFRKAGLDPDQPPRTWDEVRTAAKAITAKTGVPGFAQSTTNNTGGWILTAMTYSQGGRMEERSGGRYVASLDTEPVRTSLELLHDMRWEDRSMGTQHLRNLADLGRDFAAGRVGMMVTAPNAYYDHVTKYHGKPEIFGAAALPNGSTSATLLGGEVAVVNPKATRAERAAAVKWIDFYHLRARYDAAYAEDRAKAKAADQVPVGVATVYFYGPEVSAKVRQAEQRHANVPLANFAPFERDVAGQQFVTEPPIAAQDVYGALDNVVQAVLTRSGARPTDELRKAEDRVRAAVARAQR